MDVNQIITFIGVIIGLLSLIVAVTAVVVTITTPELRHILNLKDDKPPVDPTWESIKEKTTPPSGPFSATLHENQPQFIEAAKTSLSIVFNEEYKIVTLTIAPDGKQSPNRAVLNGYTEEFTSSAGDFLLHVYRLEQPNNHGSGEPENINWRYDRCGNALQRTGGPADAGAKTKAGTSASVHALSAAYHA